MATVLATQGKDYRRVREIRIRRLFGLYDHTVPLFLNERVTIIHGPNGVGKTILLKLIQALFSGDIPFLLYVPYESLSVVLDDETKIEILQERSDPAMLPKRSPLNGILHFSIGRLDQRGRSQFDIAAKDLNFDEWANQYQKTVPWINPLGPGRWLDQRTQQLLSSFELWKLAADENPDRQLPVSSIAPPPQYGELSKLVSTFFVETQRLIRYSSTRRPLRSYVSSPTPTVTHIAQALSRRFGEAFAQYGHVSQALDQKFPQRLFAPDTHTMSVDEIKNAIQAQEQHRELLQRFGILETPVTYPFDVSLLDSSNKADLKAMTLFVQDTNEKLEILGQFVRRVAPLLDSINNKFKNKRIQIDKEAGLIAKSDKGTDIELDQLSSGEQHECVILYDLLFRVATNTLVMIDEPELSLHIDWQRRFLPELMSIAKEAGFDALIATHSPQIIGEREDLMIALRVDSKNSQDG